MQNRSLLPSFYNNFQLPLYIHLFIFITDPNLFYKNSRISNFAQFRNSKISKLGVLILFSANIPFQELKFQRDF